MTKRVAIKEIGIVDVTIAIESTENCIHWECYLREWTKAGYTYHVRVPLEERVTTVSNAPRMLSKLWLSVWHCDYLIIQRINPSTPAIPPLPKVLVSNTLLSTSAMSASWLTHRKAAVISEVPILRPKTERASVEGDKAECKPDVEPCEVSVRAEETSAIIAKRAMIPN